MQSKLYSFDTGQEVIQKGYKVDSVIDRLKDLLTKAEKGELHGLAAVGVHADESGRLIAEWWHVGVGVTSFGGLGAARVLLRSIEDDVLSIHPIKDLE